jgi:hypothetical protein
VELSDAEREKLKDLEKELEGEQGTLQEGDMATAQNKEKKLSIPDSEKVSLQTHVTFKEDVIPKHSTGEGKAQSSAPTSPPSKPIPIAR